jgi:tetratricopeptide (TPR) repeat protein
VVLNPELPLRLQDVINNCLEKDRELRYQSAADLRADLKRVRRDIESGQSNAAVSAMRRPSGSTAEVASGSGPRTASVPARRSLLAWGGGLAAALILLAAGGAYVMRHREPLRVPDSRPVAETPNPAVTSRVALAVASLDARNYRAALAYADQVLALEPKNAEAIKVHDAAQQMIGRFDNAIADARRRLSARDLRGAGQALEAARQIDPGAPSVTELTLRLAQESRPREELVDTNRRGRTAAEQRRDPKASVPSASTDAPPKVESATPPPPRIDTRPVEPPPSGPPAGAGTAIPVAPPAPPPAPAQSTPAETLTLPNRSARERAQTPPPAPAPEQDEAAIGRVIAAYARAIETKDVRLFRSIKPNLSREEERRLEESFRAVTSQRVNATILSIDRHGDQATVVLRRRDTIRAGGREQTVERQQSMTLTRAGRDWTILDIR